MSSPIAIDNEIERVSRLLADDKLDFFHLNKPDFEFSQMDDFLLQIDSSLHHKIMIHSHYSLIEKYDLAGISINNTDLSQLAYADEVDKCFIQPMVLRDRKIEINRLAPSRVSYFAFSMSEIQNLEFDTDYVLLNPFIEKAPKVECFANDKNIFSLKESLRNIKTNVVACGNPKEYDITTLKDIGFSGYVSLSDCWSKQAE